MYRDRHFKVVIGAMAVLRLIILASLVYAGFTGQLNITGATTARQSKWDIHFENLSNITTTGSAKVLSQTELDGTTTIEDYSATVTSPSDTISFTFKVVNDGNYDASISSVSVGTPECSGTDSTSNNNVCGKLTYSLTYEGGATVQTGDVVGAKDYVIMKVTLTYQSFSDASLLPTEDVSISNLGITINYAQSGSALVKDNGEVANYRVYHQGEKITLNNEDYYVITDSGADKDYVVALKDLPLTVAEVNLYGGAGTEDNHVNRYTSSSQGVAYNSGGYGGMAYYTSQTCGYVYGTSVATGCKTDYDESDIKYVVDAWALDKFQNDQLKEVEGYNVRLITLNELVNNLGCVSNNCSNSLYNWVTIIPFWYWTMTQYKNDSISVWIVQGNNLGGGQLFYNYRDRGGSDLIRPVINVYKSAIENE